MPPITHATTDISLASALVCLGYKITGCHRLGYSQVEFVLQHDEKDDSDLEGNLHNFYNRDLRVDALTLFETHKSLKGRASDVLRREY